MTRAIPRGLVENKARQELARALMRRGPRTARELMKDTGRSVACLRHHLRALTAVGAITPFLRGATRGNEVAYVLTAERLPEWARDILRGEASLRMCFRLIGIFLSEGPQDTGELADRLGLSEVEVVRYIKALELDSCTDDTRRFGTGNRAKRLIEHDPEWVDRWFEVPGNFEVPRKEDDEPGPREDGAE